MEHGARNQLTGKITAIKRGDVMCQVTVETAAGPMTSVMTTESLDSLGVKDGDEVCILVKAVNVLLARE